MTPTKPFDRYLWQRQSIVPATPPKITGTNILYILASLVLGIILA